MHNNIYFIGEEKINEKNRDWGTGLQSRKNKNGIEDPSPNSDFFRNGDKMSLRIIYGKSGSGKSEYCFKEIAKLVKTEKKIYIITPEQFSFTAEKKLMDAIDTKAVINAEVLTISRMAHRVLQELGGNTKTQLTKCGKSMLIYSILNENKSNLKFLSKSDENIDLSMTAITEFKKHGVLPEDLKQEIIIKIYMVLTKNREK